jgi:hypothetical protein
VKLALSEGGIGWIPYYLERLDRWFSRHKYWSTKRKMIGHNADGSANPDFGKMVDDEAEVNLPIDFDFMQAFRDHVYGCALADADQFGLTAGLEFMGTDNVMVESDFPHADTSWPNSMAMLRKSLGHLSEDVQYKLLQGNARRIYHIDTPEPDVAPGAVASGAVS